MGHAACGSGIASAAASGIRHRQRHSGIAAAALMRISIPVKEPELETPGVLEAQTAESVVALLDKATFAQTPSQHFIFTAAGWQSFAHSNALVTFHSFRVFKSTVAFACLALEARGITT